MPPARQRAMPLRCHATLMPKYAYYAVAFRHCRFRYGGYVAAFAATRYTLPLDVLSSYRIHTLLYADKAPPLYAFFAI